MTDRAETLSTTLAICEGYAAELQVEVAGALDERSQLQDVVDVPGVGWSPTQVAHVIESCEEALGVTVTDSIRDGSTTIGQLVDALMAAELMPDAAPPTSAEPTGGLVLALYWTGENSAEFGIGHTTDAALRALRESHPMTSIMEDRVEFVDAPAAPWGGWAGTIDP